jgi:hypothetical protein
MGMFFKTSLCELSFNNQLPFLDIQKSVQNTKNFTGFFWLVGLSPLVTFIKAGHITKRFLDCGKQSLEPAVTSTNPANPA